LSLGLFRTKSDNPCGPSLTKNIMQHHPHPHQQQQHQHPPHRLSLSFQDQLDIDSYGALASPSYSYQGRDTSQSSPACVNDETVKDRRLPSTSTIGRLHCQHQLQCPCQCGQSHQHHQHHLQQQQEQQQSQQPHQTTLVPSIAATFPEHSIGRSQTTVLTSIDTDNPVLGKFRSLPVYRYPNFNVHSFYLFDPYPTPSSVVQAPQTLTHNPLSTNSPSIDYLDLSSYPFPALISNHSVGAFPMTPATSPDLQHITSVYEKLVDMQSPITTTSSLVNAHVSQHSHHRLQYHQHQQHPMLTLGQYTAQHSNIAFPGMRVINEGAMGLYMDTQGVQQGLQKHPMGRPRSHSLSQTQRPTPSTPSQKKEVQSELKSQPTYLPLSIQVKLEHLPNPNTSFPPSASSISNSSPSALVCHISGNHSNHAPLRWT